MSLSSIQKVHSENGIGPEGSDTGCVEAIYEVVEIDRGCAAISVVYLKAVDRILPHKAGQYASVTFPGQSARDFSLACPPNLDGTLELHVRDMGTGPSAFVARSLVPGDQVTVTGPYGQAVLQEAEEGPLLLIAGGAGLAPAKAICEAALAQRPERDVMLFHGVRDEEYIYQEKHFLALEEAYVRFRYNVVLSEPKNPTKRMKGRVDEIALGRAPLTPETTIYLFGSPAMVNEARDNLLKAGVDPGRLLGDAFEGQDKQTAKKGLSSS